MAAARNGVIGAGGRLPWRIADDLKWFKRVTMGKPIVMGRKTFDSIGRALPGRDNIVVTRQHGWRAERVICADSLEAALLEAKARAEQVGADEICVIGGAQIYRQALPLAGRIYLTRVATDVEGEATFPVLNRDDWREVCAGGCEAGAKNDHACDFFILDRLQAPV
ncbi:dihydrofolate reductase [Amphiplicatus metriothermophilus]|uniref:Dihydrofolate reductase n=1 Tax=Amphiplicatus metriothermophilus TaxID=1519374 RepID=A0A239PQC0_9PROT|nr:dihydrofolate reductase [Amphiplicatus metriothermophilus]MBB5518356.1 dihydrofolate reductase [Amphiplicatus metriothermophilus]SNT72475.1 dihydrofolate reductase [Amphiplicatus metriothermophilus]